MLKGQIILHTAKNKFKYALEKLIFPLLSWRTVSHETKQIWFIKITDSILPRSVHTN